jgi:epoxyqueuosine reductase
MDRAAEPARLAGLVTSAALELGFARVGFTPVERFARAEARLEQWLARGYHGEMAYLAGGGRGDPAALLAEAKTLIVVALAHPRPATPLRKGAAGPVLTGAIAGYARGADYHWVMKRKLAELSERCASFAGRPVLARPAVDSAPLLEHEAAARSGVGFTAKSTLTLAPGLGTYFLLGELLIDVDIAPSDPLAPGCGSCRACLDACPTGAFVAPYVLDARRCISYLTIELRGTIPRELRASIGTRAFGCDECQAVCPYNAGQERASAPELQPTPDGGLVDLVEWLELGSAAYRRLVKGRALARASRQRLARNAAVALGNSGDRRAIEPLARALSTHPSPLVREHAAWALGRLGGEAAAAALEHARDTDPTEAVKSEARLALAELAAIA